MRYYVEELEGDRWVTHNFMTFDQGWRLAQGLARRGRIARLRAVP